LALNPNPIPIVGGFTTRWANNFLRRFTIVNNQLKHFGLTRRLQTVRFPEGGCELALLDECVEGVDGEADEIKKFA
jgi:hypothetical protein